MVLVALFIIGKERKQPKCSSTDENEYIKHDMNIRLIYNRTLFGLSISSQDVMKIVI